MFLLQRPSRPAIARFIDESRALPLSYDPVGIAAESPDGFTVDEASVVVGRGAAAFARARSALQQWAHFDLGWVHLAPSGAPVEVGAVVGVVVNHLSTLR